MGKLLLVGFALAGEPARKAFDVPADAAAISLKRFAEQAGQEIIYPVDDVKGVKTNPVIGDFTAREALDRLVAATDLVVAQNKATGALAVSRKTSESNGPRAANSTAADRPANEKK